MWVSELDVQYLWISMTLHLELFFTYVSVLVVELWACSSNTPHSSSGQRTEIAQPTVCEYVFSCVSTANTRRKHTDSTCLH